MRLVLLVGTGRCGSTLLSDILRSHPDVLSASELFASLQPDGLAVERMDGGGFWRLLSQPRRLASLMVRYGIQPEEFLYPLDGTGRFPPEAVPPIATTMLPHLTDDPDGLFDELAAVVPGFPDDALGRQYERLLAWLAARFDKPLVVERSGGSLEYLAPLLAAFPESTVVHVVRDGAACALSMREHSGYRIMKIGRLLTKSLGFNPFVEDRPYDPAAVPAELRPLLPDRLSGRAFFDYPFTAEEFGWVWSAMVVQALPLLKQLGPERLHTVRYETLIAEPEMTLGRLAQFSGIDDAQGSWAAGGAARMRTGRSGSRVATLDREERQRLQHATARTERRLRELEMASAPSPGGPPP